MLIDSNRVHFGRNTIAIRRRPSVNWSDSGHNCNILMSAMNAMLSHDRSLRDIACNGQRLRLRHWTHPFHQGFCRENKLEGNVQNFGLSKATWKGKLKAGSGDGSPIGWLSPLFTITTDGSKSISKSGRSIASVSPLMGSRMCPFNLYGLSRIHLLIDSIPRRRWWSKLIDLMETGL